MTQKTIVLTGASDGIGAAAAEQLAARGHRLLLVGRSPSKTSAVAASLGAEHLVADFARLDEVRELASRIRDLTDHVDVLANNAGGIFGRRELTVDGVETTWQVNHLAPFLLTHLLLDRLRAGEGTVVNTSSSAPRRFSTLSVDELRDPPTYRPSRAYGDAKLANILFTRGLEARYSSDGISSVAFDPGNVRTNFASATTSIVRLVYRTPLSRLVLIPPEKGGANLAFFVEGSAGSTWLPGRFYTQTRLATPAETNPRIFDDALVDEVWSRSSELTGLPAA